MKKIGILTASRTNNFGTDLQAYAMQEIFSRYADVEIINYACTKLEKSHRLLQRLDIKSIIRLPYQIFKNISHSLFRKKYFCYSPIKYTPNNLNDICERYDAIVVGSDQIWNLNITGNDLNFFLPWHSVHARKFSYSASIGLLNILDFEKEYSISKFLNDFEKVSVRESSAVTLLESIGVNACENLDPIQMLGSDAWRRFYKQKRNTKPYMLIYQVETPVSICNKAIEYAQGSGYNVIRISPPTFSHSGIKRCSYLSLKKWINLMVDASVVLTDSYHGLSFCIANHVNFRLIDLPSKEKNTRSYCLLKKLSLENFTNENSAYGNTPNWLDVDKRLIAERRKSFDYIKRICCDNEVNS